MTADFWRSADTHVQVTPQRPEDASGLAPFVEHTLGKRGWLLFQTSGSEAAAKWVLLSKAAMLVSAEAVNAHLESTSKDRWLIALPTHHVGGFSILARAYVSGAAVQVLAGKWDAHRFAAACHEHRTTLSSLVPTQVFDLVQARLTAPPSLRAIVVGGGALAPEIGLRASELGWPVLQSYGMTEACSQIATEPLDHLYTGYQPDILEVLPHWAVSVDAEQRLVLRGDALAAGWLQITNTEDHYLRAAPASSMALVSENNDSETPASAPRQTRFQYHPIPPLGLITRDQVTLWQHGTRRFLRFLGRDSQVLKINGELLHLQPLQARLDATCLALGLPLAAVLVPMPHARQGTALVLAHGADVLPDPAALLAAYNHGAPPLARVLDAIALPLLPRSALGKILLPELLKSIAAAAGRAGE